MYSPILFHLRGAATPPGDMHRYMVHFGLHRQLLLRHLQPTLVFLSALLQKNSALIRILRPSANVAVLPARQTRNRGIKRPQSGGRQAKKKGAEAPLIPAIRCNAPYAG